MHRRGTQSSATGLVVAVATAAACARQNEGPAAWLTMPTPAAHDRWFPIARGQHAIACNDCHGQSDTFKTYDCIGCHTQPATSRFHSGVTAYQWDSPSCYACHPRGSGTMNPADHAAFFPIGAGQSHEVAGPGVSGCTSCHADFSTPENLDCTACHQQSGGGTPGPAAAADQTLAHSGKVGTVPTNLWLGSGAVGTGAGATARCLGCHAADAQAAGFVAVHGKASSSTGNSVFPIGSSRVAHFVSCEQCHTAKITDPRRRNAELDFNRASCDACHVASGTNNVSAEHTSFGVLVPGPYTAGDPNNSTACLTCHQTGEGAANFSHSWFPISAGDVHNSSVAKCADCHADPASYQGPPAANIGLITCTACHDDNSANVRFQNGVTITAAHAAARVGRDIWDVPGGMNYADDALCLKCHAGNVPATTFTTALVIRLRQHDTHCSLSGKNLVSGDTTHSVSRNADNGVNTCFACHNALASGSNTPWATDWTVASPTSSCIACHEHQQSRAPSVRCQ